MVHLIERWFRLNFWGGFCLNRFRLDCHIKLTIVHSFGFGGIMESLKRLGGYIRITIASDFLNVF